MTAAFAVHHGRWRASAVIAGAMIAMEIATRALMAMVKVASTRSGSWAGGFTTEVFRSAVHRPLVTRAKLRAMPFLSAGRIEALRLRHAAFDATLRRRAFAAVAGATMHHGRRALAMIGTSAEGLAAFAVTALWLHVATEGRMAAFTRAVVAAHFTFAGTAEAFTAVASITRASELFTTLAITRRAAMALGMIAFAARLRAGTAGIAFAMVFGIRAAFGLSATGFGTAFWIATTSVTTLGLGRTAFWIGIGTRSLTRSISTAGLGVGWWGVRLAGFWHRSWRGFGCFLGGKSGDAESAERQQQETMAGFGFHGLEGGWKPWEAGRSWGATAP